MTRPFLRGLTGGFLDGDGDCQRTRRAEQRLKRAATTGGLDDARIPVVPFVRFRCPRCKAPNPRTYGMKALVRYHRCRSCSAVFKSVELAPAEALARLAPAARAAFE